MAIKATWLDFVDNPPLEREVSAAQVTARARQAASQPHRPPTGLETPLSQDEAAHAERLLATMGAAFTFAALALSPRKADRPIPIDLPEWKLAAYKAFRICVGHPEYDEPQDYHVEWENRLLADLLGAGRAERALLDALVRDLEAMEIRVLSQNSEETKETTETFSQDIGAGLNAPDNNNSAYPMSA